MLNLFSTLFNRFTKNLALLPLRGALTNKPTAFRSRSWELRSIQSIDIFDSLNNIVEINIRGNTFIRILPTGGSGLLVPNESNWISDRIRYSVDAFLLQRLDTPLVVLKTNFSNVGLKLKPLAWKNLFKIFSQLNLFEAANFSPALTISKGFRSLFFHFYNTKSTPLDLLDYIQIDRLYNFFCFNFYSVFGPFVLNSHLLQPMVAARQLVAHSNNDYPTAVLNLKNFLTLFIVGSEIATINPTIWAYINQLITKGVLSVYTFGDAQITKFSSLTKNFKHIGPLSEFKKLLDGRHWLSTKLFERTSNRKTQALVALRLSSLNDFLLLNYINQLSTTVPNLILHIFPLLSTNTTINNLLLGLSSKITPESLNETLSINSLVASREVQPFSFTKNPLSLYLSSHYTPFVTHTNVVIPTSAFFEKNLFFQNLLGNLKQTTQIQSAPGLAINPSLFLILLYSLLLKNFKNKELMSAYLFDFIIKFFLLTKNSTAKLLFLHKVASSGIANKLTLSLLLQIFEATLNVHTFANINFALCVPSFDLRPSISNLWSISDLRSSGYLQFNDELTLHSKALIQTSKALTKYY